MKKVLVIHLNDTETEEQVEFLGQQIQLIYKGTLGDGARAAALLAEYDGKVDAIALDGLPPELPLGGAHRPRTVGAGLRAFAY